MAAYFERVFCTTSGVDHYFEWCRLGVNRNSPYLEHMAGKTLGEKDAPWRRRQLHSLVLGRAVDLANTATKLAVCCYIKSTSCYIYHLHDKITNERGL